MVSIFQKQHQRIFFSFFAFLVFLLLCGNFIIPAGYLCFVHFWKLSPRLEVPETYQIGGSGWVGKGLIQVDKFEAEVVYSELNMLNWRSMIQYTISGQIMTRSKGSSSSRSVPVIGKIHVSQRYLLMGDSNHSASPSYDIFRPGVAEALVDLQPLVGFKSSSEPLAANQEKTSAAFSVTNQIVVGSIHMGENIIRFQCGVHWVDLFLYQRK